MKRKILILLTYLLISYILFLIINISTSNIIDISKFSENKDIKKIYMLSSSIFLFLIPSLIFIFRHYNFKKFISIKELKPKGTYLLLTLLIIIFIQPLLALSTQINDILPIGQYIKNYIRETHNTYQEILADIAIVDKKIDWAINSIVLCIIPAISEEILFRGLIQKLILSKYIKNKFTPIIITSIIFSIVHFNFFYLIPIFLISLFIGYSYLISNCIWIPIFAHFINNMLALILVQFYGLNRAFYTDNYKSNIFITITFTIISIYLIYFMSKLSSNKDKIVKNEKN